VKRQLSILLGDEFESCLKETERGDYWESTPSQTTQSFSIEPEEQGRRALRNLCLDYLVMNADRGGIELAHRDYNKSTCMTETMGAFLALAPFDAPQTDLVLKHFKNMAKGIPLVVTKIDYEGILLKSQKKKKSNNNNSNRSFVWSLHVL
jgi:aminopeptidase N